GLICMALAAFYVVCAYFALTLRKEDDLLVNSYLIGAIVLIAGALFAELKAEWVALGWAPLSLAVMAICTRVPRRGAWVTSTVLLGGSILFLMGNVPVDTGSAEQLWHPLTSNWALQSYVVFASLIGWALLAKRVPQNLVTQEQRLPLLT